MGDEVAARLSGVIGLHAADAQYHVPLQSSLDHGTFGGGSEVRPLDYG